MVELIEDDLNKNDKTNNKTLKVNALDTLNSADELKIEKNEAGDDTNKPKKRKKKSIIKMIKNGQAYIQATYNNTIVTITDQNGNVISWSSAGKLGFKGPKKATPYAAGLIVKNAVEKAIKERGLKEVNVFIKGIGAGREAAARALHVTGLTVLSLKDITPIPHNGCRPPKIRRV